ncbi:AAA family ATPase [Skermania sp. ID1734]|uniref:UvrD-helicase domain-containing protein n=1 Tax=Skermania sp. ID1734 TaxID=2597516 RepID=UPI00117E5B01|nr:UvrD-helicase domain-containing protein [Skermania sp. ID1734]TSE01827.1 AAA family ATPase [Skermania sp. ID1734]
MLTDAESRDRIRTDSATSLFVEAGAGSGKTHSLVERIRHLVLHDGVELDQIAAITFTEKAAAELRERVRAALADAGPAVLAQVDTAAIGTLHAFAARIISEHPLEAGVPPRISVVDAMGSQLSFERRWRRIRTELFSDAATAPTGLGEAMRIVVAAGASLEQVRGLADALDRHWDRLDVGCEPPTLVRARFNEVSAAAAAIAQAREDCLDHADKLVDQLDKVRDWHRNFVDATASDVWLSLVEECPGPGSGGKAASWTGGSGRVQEIKESIKKLKLLACEVRDEYVASALMIVVHHMSRVIVAEARERRHSGELEFHDLLVCARDALQDPHVAAAVHDSYQRIMLDEFQDTDPLQLEIARMIVADVAGRLFTVGDPKQSIYRFRRADIASYMAARERADAADIVNLTTNFRSTRPVIDWVNEVFGALVQPQRHIQPEYTPLDPDPGRPDWDGQDWGPGPFVFCDDEPVADEDSLTPAEALRAREARDVAKVIATALKRGWRKETPSFDHVPMKLSDICILIPSRAVLPFLEKALDAARIEFRSEASSLVYSTQEVHDLLVTCRALANTADEGVLVASLRTPLFGCGDDDLLRWKSGGGQWSIFAEPPAGLGDSAVAAALAYLRSLWLELGEMNPGALLSRLATDRRVFEVSMDSPRHRDVWRRLRFVIDQAHAWYQEDRGDLRDYLDWASAQEDENARVAEAVLPEIGVNAVRIMTIHAAKGLQFPMVILAGMSGGFRNTADPVLWDETGAMHVNLCRTVKSMAYRDVFDVEKQHIEAERIRLLYVACTRAESFLAVSGYQASRDCWGKLLADGLVGVVNQPPELIDPVPVEDPAASGVELLPWEAWQAETALVSSASSVAATVSATRIAHGGGGEYEVAVGDEVVPAGVGGIDSGTDLGTALHAVLEEGLKRADFEAVARHAAMSAGLSDVDRFVALARSAFESEPVKRAAAREHWQEIPLAGMSPDGTQVVEGIADLVYREDDGSLVIIDYKTDVGVSAGTLAEYWTQLSVYADLLRQVAGETVSRLVLVFCRVDGAVVRERTLPAV